MIGPRTDRLLHSLAIFLLILPVTFGASAKSMNFGTTAENQEKVPPLRLFSLLVKSGPLPERLLKEHLELRLPATKIWRDSAKGLSESRGVAKEEALYASARIVGQFEVLTVELRLSDGRSFRRELESIGEIQLDTRAVASAIANLVAAIESGKPLAQSSIVSSGSDSTEASPHVLGPSNDSNAQSESLVSEAGKNKESSQVAVRTRRDPSTSNTPSDRRVIREVNEGRSLSSRRNRVKNTTSNPRPMMIEFVGAPVLSLGTKDVLTILRGVGLQLGASFRTRSQFWISVGVRNCFPLSVVKTNTMLLRTLVSSSAGYIFRGGKTFEFPLEFGFTFEPWWIWRNSQRVEPLVNETGHTQRPLVGALIRIRPGIRVMTQWKRKSQMYIELPLELHMSGEARRGFSAPVIKREVQGAVLYRLGGLEINIALQVRWGIPISR